MKKIATIIGLILVLALINGCSKQESSDIFDEIETAKTYQTITGSATADITTRKTKEAETTPKTAAKDVIKEMKTLMLKNSQVFEGDFYPQIKTSKKGKEALKEKTRALHTQEIKLPTEIKADKEFGPRYYTPSKIKDLQEEKEE